MREPWGEQCTSHHCQPSSGHGIAPRELEQHHWRFTLPLHNKPLRPWFALLLLGTAPRMDSQVQPLLSWLTLPAGGPACSCLVGHSPPASTTGQGSAPAGKMPVFPLALGRLLSKKKHFGAASYRSPPLLPACLQPCHTLAERASGTGPSRCQSQGDPLSRSSSPSSPLADMAS